MQLTFTSLWPYFLIMPLCVLFAWLVVEKIPFYKKAAAADEKGRFEILDGLRGFLALNVFFQHAVTSYFYFQTGVWQIVPVRFYRHLGGEAVILFFIMTSFLYWSKAISQKGDLDTASLFRSRFLRLAPMYLFTAFIIISSVLIQSGSNIDLVATGKGVLSFLSLGLITTTSVNNISVFPINAGIHWTLHFEWVFYLLLPILALSLKNKELRFMVFLVGIFALVSPARGYWMIFFFGITAAHIYNEFPKMPFFKRKVAGLVPLAGLVMIYLMSYKPYSPVQYVISLGVFLCFVYGTDLWGLLMTKTARFLGTISYSIYLMHSIVLFAVLNSVDHFYPIMSLTPVAFWLLIAFCGVLTVAISTLTYRFIEYPFIKMIKQRKLETPKVEMVEKVM